MKLQYASDLHLEFPQNKEFLRTNPLQPLGDVLLLAGDIVPFAFLHEHVDFFNLISDSFQTAYWIPGNHEYYYFDAAEIYGVLNEKIKSNVYLVNNTSVIRDNIKFIFSTLWTRISPAYERLIERGMSDFHVIRYKGDRFSALQYNQFHEESLAFLKKELAGEKADQTVMVSHHVPTFLNYPEKYKSNALHEAFGVELKDFVATTQFDYWIYGHTHINTYGFNVGETQLLTNQLGYVEYNEHRTFNTKKILTL
jgi:predicted phosphohydrolase